MTDERYTFIEDLRDKKSTARGSKYKKRGTRSKKCSLPSDFLSAAERRKLNGEVMEYKIGKPISWKEFQSYPHEMQQKWVDSFVGRFGCASTGIAIAMGVNKSTVAAYLSNNKIVGTKAMCTPAREAMIRAWMAEGDKVPVKAPVEEPKKVVVEQQSPFFINTLQCGSLSLTGTAAEIFQTLFGIFRDAKLSVDFDFTVIHEPEEEESEDEVDSRPDVNTCSFDILKGIMYSTNVCLNIINNRPYASVEDLRNVPGVTDKLFAILYQKVKV